MSNKQAPTPAALNARDLHDYREEIEAAHEAPLESQLELLQKVATDLQTVLHGDEALSASHG
ncbi:thioredoxin [Mobiluncus curtisii]|uniref:thioredoxin n=1 Tax=Mobiluncus curtisii TaxID=2051 RepID=UPI0014702BB7|nr:thioredoxin [Mobiluncus curtisii]NMW44469.1 thioredoxin [Mobiluncus curtisii]NMW83323.1 thioredoxin [Mobiluncus curtisii]NMW98460.1 thioredoxin [Mobiluncus curtisii]NMX05187.1 thioredoxin [Mobiluncus curtisii]